MNTKTSKFFQHLIDILSKLFILTAVIASGPAFSLESEVEDRFRNLHKVFEGELPKLGLSTPTLKKLDEGKNHKFIVVFDDSEVEQEVEQLKGLQDDRLDKAAIRTFRSSALQVLKSNVLSNLKSLDFESAHDYSELPMVALAISDTEQISELLKTPEVIGVYEDQVRELFLSQSLPLIDQPCAASQGHTGSGTAVAVLDTGANFTHSAFGSCANAGDPGCSVVYAQDFPPDDGSNDDNGHGTNVAGIVRAVAPGADIIALDVFKQYWNGSAWKFGAFDSDVIDALNWTIANQAIYNIVAANLSLGGERPSGEPYGECTSSSYTSVFANMRAVGILPVVASGNNGWKDRMAAPACAPGAVRVGAVYDSNVSSYTSGTSGCTDSVTAADKVTCFSNSDDFLTLLAPGTYISAAGISMSGTSQAAPHVAGATAVLQAAFPLDSVATTEKRMRVGGVPVTDTANSITTPRLDLCAAINVSHCDLYPFSPVCLNPCLFKWWHCYDICEVKPWICEGLIRWEPIIEPQPQPDPPPYDIIDVINPRDRIIDPIENKIKPVDQLLNPVKKKIDLMKKTNLFRK